MWEKCFIFLLFSTLGEFTGAYKGNRGDGELVQMNGFACVSVTDELKITGINVYYKPEIFLKALRGETTKKLNESEFHEKKVVELLIESFMAKGLKPKLKVNGKEVKTCEYDKTLIESLHNNFPFEVLEVFTERKEIAFSWRHWMEVKEKEDKIELKGFAIIEIDQKDDINDVRVFYKPRDIPIDCLEKIKGCIFARTNN